MKTFIHVFIATNLLFYSSAAFSKEEKSENKKPSLNIRELALPSEIQSINKAAGSIYYSPSVKDKVLMPVHFWGEVSKTGLHFIPLDTTLVKGLSMAGGPRSDGVLDGVKITRKNGEKLETRRFDLTEGGDSEAHKYKLQPGDTVFIRKSEYFQNRAYYTSLIGVLATTLSTILVYREVKRDRR